MYILLASKVGQYRTELSEGLVAAEIYHYLFNGSVCIQFVIAQLAEPMKIRVVDEGPPETVNHVPSKFFPRFEDLAQARQALTELTVFSQLDTHLVKVSPSSLNG
ncbi:ferredoxin [Burkholderia guangdongensis]|uniref:ferredoxin n=1 Tax=Burkholderia guangdongensis TaxID=1792500 RepID=UPI0015CAD361|nr:ferredoxin [Burkholderia guangdongensis]